MSGLSFEEFEVGRIAYCKRPALMRKRPVS